MAKKGYHSLFKKSNPQRKKKAKALLKSTKKTTAARADKTFRGQPRTAPKGISPLQLLHDTGPHRSNWKSKYDENQSRGARALGRESTKSEEARRLKKRHKAKRKQGDY